MDFEVFGMDIFAGRQNDDVFAAADDVKMAVLVDLSQVAGAKPSVVGERLGIRRRILVIALENHRAFDQNFADAFFVGIVDLDLGTVHRLADASRRGCRLRMSRSRLRSFRSGRSLAGS